MEKLPFILSSVGGILGFIFGLVLPSETSPSLIMRVMTGQVISSTQEDLTSSTGNLLLIILSLALVGFLLGLAIEKLQEAITFSNFRPIFRHRLAPKSK